MDQNPEPLYERDFYLWLDQQIKIIESGNLTNLDVTNLVEEVKPRGSLYPNKIVNCELF